MASVLEEICARKALHIEKAKKQIPLTQIKAAITNAEAPRGFINALKEKIKTGQPAFITEIKKASPSKGIIREDFSPADIAKIYEANGSACLSVLTDEPYFQGHDDYLRAAKKASTLPALRKDFMIDEYQIYESRALGADCILLIMACLSDDIAKKLYEISSELGMDTLIEVHNKEELDRAIALSPAMIGINNRNLKTLDVDIQTSFGLAELIPPTCLSVSESGISDAQTIQKLQNAGFGAFLIGEGLMRKNDIGKALRALSEH